MNDPHPHLPASRSLLWSDEVYAFQEAVSDLNLRVPLYIVGGAVRDAFLHRPIKDIDLATPGDAIRIARQIANSLHGDIFVMDQERGVARVFLKSPQGDLTVDVTRYRSESLLLDLQERDFTVNAMAVDLAGDLKALIDPLGGEADAVAKLMRRCSDHALADDPVRALRAIRQSVQLSFRIDPATAHDIRQAAPQMTRISPERVRDEFFALLSLERLTAALRVADSLGVLEVLMPQLHLLKGVSLPAPHVYDGWKTTLETVERLAGVIRSISYRRTDHTAASFGLGMVAIQLDRFRGALNQHLQTEWANGRSHYALLMLAALIHVVVYLHPEMDADEQVKQLVEQVVDDFRLSGQEKKRLVMVLTHYRAAQHIDYWDVLTRHRFWYRADAAGIDACLFALAAHLAAAGIELKQDQWLVQVERVVVLLDAYFTHYDQIVAPQPLLSGNDLMAVLGIPAGPVIGEMLDALREAQVAGQVISREDALRFASEYARR